MTEKPGSPLPRTAILWLLMTQCLALLLHVPNQPLWLWGLVGAVVGWRLLMLAGRLSYPGRLIKAAAVAAASMAVILAFERQLTLESAVAFLIAASVLKLLEMRVRRDGYVIGYLNFFLLGTGFLFDQGLLSGLYGVAAVWLLTTALITVHFSASAQDGVHTTTLRRSRQAARLAASVLLMSLPMMLVLYLLFPRLGPLWSFTLQSGQARTGLSAEMASGDIVNLSQSDELAFRASFSDGRLPEREQLYWRALVLDQYDGRRWKQTASEDPVIWYSGEQTPPATADFIRYEIVQESTGENWLFALDGVRAIERGTGVSSAGLLVARRPVYQRQRYLAESRLERTASVEIRAAGERYLQLPDGGNPRSRQLAEQYRQKYPDDVERVAALVRMFREQPFYYTLRPPAMAADEVDDFLFSARRGFCAHYAGALVFLARSSGIPARVVTGYQGGEWNAAEQYLTVRQFDAHAWAEVWLPRQGWVQVDPTAAVAPDRIRFGLEEAVAEEGSFLQEQLFSAHKLRGVNWLNDLRLQFDSLNYYWQLWVLSYDNQRQQSFLQSVLGLSDYQQALYWLGSSFMVFFVLASAWLWWRLRPAPRSAFMRSWQRLQDKGRRLGAAPGVSETAAQYCQRLAQLCPQQRTLLLWLADEVNRVLYQPDADPAIQQKRLQALYRAVRRISRQLPAGQAQKQPSPATFTKGP